MTTHTDDKWIDDLIVELRLRQVPGPAIGDAVASVRELLADSGQSAEEAFGSARAYAASLEFPNAATRDWTLSALPIVGLIALLVFTYATIAWVEQENVRFSATQVALLAVPALLALTLPLYLTTVVRHRWLFVPLTVVAVGAGVLSALLAPATASDAWIAAPAFPWLTGAAVVMLVESIVGTILAVRNRTTDEIIEPLAGPDGSAQRRGWHPTALIVHWIFPIFALLVFVTVNLSVPR